MGALSSRTTTNSPRQQADSAPIVDTNMTRPSCDAENWPSATAMTAVTSSTPAMCATAAAASAATHGSTPGVPLGTSARNTNTPSPHASDSSARLNHTLIGF
jgi:hypothetical protein